MNVLSDFLVRHGQCANTKMWSQELSFDCVVNAKEQLECTASSLNVVAMSLRRQHTDISISSSYPVLRFIKKMDMFYVDKELLAI